MTDLTTIFDDLYEPGSVYAGTISYGTNCKWIRLDRRTCVARLEFGILPRLDENSNEIYYATPYCTMLMPDNDIPHNIKEAIYCTVALFVDYVLVARGACVEATYTKTAMEEAWLADVYKTMTWVETQPSQCIQCRRNNVSAGEKCWWCGCQN